MKDLYNRVRGDLDLTRLAQFLETRTDTQVHNAGIDFARQVRDMRDRLLAGPPVTASDLDIEHFLAVDMLKQIRNLFKIPDDKAILPFLSDMVESWQTPSAEEMSRLYPEDQIDI